MRRRTRATGGLRRLRVTWEGPFSLEEVLKKRGRVGAPPDYDSEDYGLYQIYGEHIIAGPNTLLYVGKATHQTFSARFRQHRAWLMNEWRPVQIFLGGIWEDWHSKDDQWSSWVEDVRLAERVIIHKYSPNYNSSSIARLPKTEPFKSVVLVHAGDACKLHKVDRAPMDLL